MNTREKVIMQSLNVESIRGRVRATKEYNELRFLAAFYASTCIHTCTHPHLAGIPRTFLARGKKEGYTQRKKETCHGNEREREKFGDSPPSSDKAGHYNAISVTGGGNAPCKHKKKLPRWKKVQVYMPVRINIYKLSIYFYPRDLVLLEMCTEFKTF